MILWVEDDVELLNAMIRNLTNRNVDCVGFSHPDEALAYIKAGNMPTAMVTDYNMPSMTGVELSVKVREILPNIPILFCSGSVHKDMNSIKNSLIISKCCSTDSVIDDIHYLLEKEK
jgi:CheY-like chemotaxis protein